MPKHHHAEIELIRTWTLSPAATLGSSVRAKGILQELQSRLPTAVRKSLVLDGIDLVLAMPADAKAVFNATAAIVAGAMTDVESLPVIPREIQDILNIKTSERHRWLSDGRLPSAGTRTVRLNGRARRITFHVFDPKVVEDLLDSATVEEWRIEDAQAKAEKRERAAYQSKLTRSLREADKAKRTARDKPDEPASKPDEPASLLRGWDEFDIDGLLR